MNPDLPRALFVDDEPLVLQGLQRMLRPLRDEWDLSFAGSGKEALELMAQQPFDVIVTDMRMPGMNGAQLLQEVVARHPLTIRVVLSGHADRDLVSQCVGVAHQYMAKPCEQDQLKQALRNAGLLGGRVVTPEVKQVIGAMDRLPSLPSLYLELREALDSDTANSQLLGNIIQKDIGMTAKILKLVNSPFFGLRRTVTNAQDAVSYLGIETIKVLVLANGIFEATQPLKSRLFTLEDLWHHSMAVASSAKAIAKAEGKDRSFQDECFVGGMLHDIGILVLSGGFPEAYDRAGARVLAEHLTVPEAELAEFGCTHAEVGAYLLGLWGLPPEILRIIRMHHGAGLEQEPQLTPALVVHAADVLAGMGKGHPLFEHAHFHLEAIEHAGLRDHLAKWQQVHLSSTEA